MLMSPLRPKLNILTTLLWTATTFFTDIYGSLRMNPTNFSDALDEKSGENHFNIFGFE